MYNDRMKGGRAMKKYRYVTPYTAETFRFELQSILGSSLDGCCFDGEPAQNSFRIRRNYLFGTKGFPRAVLDGKFYGENSKTHIVITPRYSSNYAVSQIIIAVLFFALGIYPFACDRDSGLLSAALCGLCLWGLGLLFLAVFHVAVIISARLSINRLRKSLSIELDLEQSSS